MRYRPQRGPPPTCHFCGAEIGYDTQPVTCVACRTAAHVERGPWPVKTCRACRSDPTHKISGAPVGGYGHQEASLMAGPWAPSQGVSP